MEPLDPQAVNLAKAIRQVESGGDFSAKGKSGEYGAYQFTPDTWAKQSSEAGINVPLDKSTKEQQNQVAYTKIKSWKDKGFNPGQIASMWNAGEGKPDAYLDNSFKGTNKYGASYDVPAYAKSVATAYQTIKQGGQVQADPNNPSSTANPNQPEQSNYNPDASLLGKVGQTIENIPDSVAHTIGNIGSAVLHPIKTIETVGRGAVGGVEQGLNAVTGGKVQDQNTQTFDAIVNGLKDRYGSLDKIQKTAVTDPAGFALDLYTALEGGAGALDVVSGAGKAAKAADLARAAGETVEPVATARGLLNDTLKSAGSIAAKPIKAVAKIPYNLATSAIGVGTGVGGDVIRAGISSALKGGEAYNSFVEGLRGGASPEQLVGQAREALQAITDNRRMAYQEQLTKIAGNTATYDISPIVEEVGNQLEKFGIKKTNTGLDFSRSKFALDPSAQKDIEKLVGYVDGYGLKTGDRTAVGIDNLKKVIGSYYSPNSDYRSFTQGIKSAIWNPESKSGVLSKVPGYEKLAGDYGRSSGLIEDIQKGLSLGDKASVETSFKKLISSMKQNNEFRKQLVQELDRVNEGGLLTKIAGQQMSSFMPRGLAKYGNELAGMHAILTGSGFVPLLGILMGTSPRMVGELLGALGLPARKVASLMKLLGKLAPVSSETGVVTGGLLNRLNSANLQQSPQSLSPQQ